jgi:hypothetical protein
MKKLLVLLAAISFHAGLMAQQLTLRFEGGNANSDNERNYTVDIDGTAYYSSTAEELSNGRARQVEINNLTAGSHTIKVYRGSNNTAISSSGSEAPLYSNSFQLRQGYDMVVSIRRNGQVSFTEKKNASYTASTSGTAMSEAKFNTLLTSVKGKWSQSSRYAAVKSALKTKSNYFTTEQAGQLLMQLTSEAQRLELAKLAYPRITDTENFSEMTTLFKSQANRDKMDDFLASKSTTANSVAYEGNYAKASMTAQQFNQLVRTVKNQYRQEGKYAVINDAFQVTTNYFTTAQVRQLLNLVTAENDRLALAKLSYARVTDPGNFATLYNLFTTANRTELDNYIRYGATTTVNTGQYSNRVAMSSGEFTRLEMKARLHFRQSSVVEDIREALSDKNNYFTLEQTRSLLSMITEETDRLALAKLAYHRITDPSTFVQLMDLFTTQTNKDDLNNYIRNNPS